MKIVTVDVTQNDIDAGDSHADSCPVALAISRAMDRPVLVCRDCWAFWPETGTFYPMPEAAGRFIELFDNGLPVEPFSFTVEIDD